MRTLSLFFKFDTCRIFYLLILLNNQLNFIATHDTLSGCFHISKLVSNDTRTMLMQYLCERVNRHVPPRLTSDPVKVDLNVILTRISEINLRKSTFSMNAWINMVWTSEITIWDPKMYGKITSIRAPPEIVWQPKIRFYNAKTEIYKDSIIILHADGKVESSIAIDIVSSCDYSIEYFPFDHHVCYIQLGPWSEDTTSILIGQSSRMSVDNLEKNPEWTLYDYEISLLMSFYGGKIFVADMEPFSSLNLTLCVERNSLLYYNYAIIIPCVLLSIVTLLSFWIPCDSGEKLSIGVSIFLGYVLFGLVVAKLMPTHALNEPLLGSYLIVCMIMCAVSSIFETAVSYIYHQSHFCRTIPYSVRNALHNIDRVLFGFYKSRHSITVSTVLDSRRSKLLETINLNRHNKNKADVSVAATKNGHNMFASGKSHKTNKSEVVLPDSHKKKAALQKLQSALKMRRGSLQALIRVQERESEEWKVLTDITDRILFIIYSLTLIALTLLLLVVYPIYVKTIGDENLAPTKVIDKIRIVDVSSHTHTMKYHTIASEHYISIDDIKRARQLLNDNRS